MKRSFIIAALVLLTVAGGVMYSLYPHCPLSKYGLNYRIEGAASPSLTTIIFYIKDNPSKIKCPWFDSTSLEVHFDDLDRDGVEEIVVTSEYNSSARSVVKVIIKDGKVAGFRILENYAMNINFSYNTAEPAT